MVGIIELFPELGLFPDGAAFRLRSARARGGHGCELLELREEDLHGFVRARLPDVYRAIRQYAAEKAREVRVRAGPPPSRACGPPPTRISLAARRALGRPGA
jgi:hypothetical protein